MENMDCEGDLAGSWSTPFLTRKACIENCTANPTCQTMYINYERNFRYGFCYHSNFRTKCVNEAGYQLSYILDRCPRGKALRKDFIIYLIQRTTFCFVALSKYDIVFFLNIRFQHCIFITETFNCI